MEFLPSKDMPSGPIEALRVNWYYRPRDIQRRVADTRLVFASMHSDTCPLSSLRGKCQIRHLSEIENFDEYRKSRDSFWYDKMFDRYIHRYYDVIPTSKVINVPANVKKVLDDRWKFVLVEIGKRKELTAAVKTCKRCSLYAAKYVFSFFFCLFVLFYSLTWFSTDSVDCAVCHNTYHMYCVRPALTKKPARGFAWACAACSRAQERKLEARHTSMIGDAPPEGEEEIPEEEEEDPNSAANGTKGSTPAAAEDAAIHPATEEQTAQARMWPFRYLGIHCGVEDVLDYDDRIYPRASSRLGPRHQAMVNPWPGRPVEYVKPTDIKKKYLQKSSSRKDSKLGKETLAAIEAARQELANRPKWVMDEPTGYVRRGEDEPVTVNGKSTRTSDLLFKMPTTRQIPFSSRGEDDTPGSDLSPEEREKFIDDYMARAKEIAPTMGLEKWSTNFLDKALELLYAHSFDVDAALTKLKKSNKYKDLKEPHLRPEELKLFEQGVSKYGSELRNVTKHVKTVPHYQIVRFYYVWKKSPRGKQIWGNYEGRKGKKEAKRDLAAAKLADDVADDQDDSAFDADKAAEKKRGFTCKFCHTRNTRQWRRAPAVAPGTTVPAEASSSKKDKSSQLMVALCLRCAQLWRKYGIQWENVDEVAKKISQSGNKSWRRRMDEELLVQLLMTSETPVTINSGTAAAAAALGVSVNESTPQTQEQPSKRKGHHVNDKESAANSTTTSVEPAPAKKKKSAVTEKPEPPPIIPDPPKARTLPCAVCNRIEPVGNDHLSCRDCRLTVHRNCYGVSPTRNGVKWLCDMCSNDRSPMISTCYECVLCPVTWTEHELMESPKVSHKKKSDRDREKERLEKEMVQEAIKLYRQRQEAVGKPIGPREPLKRTVGNNWVHVMCAIWTPEIKFGTAKELEPAEGFGFIPSDRYREVCKICKSNKGACVSCHHSGCNARFHIGCAFQAQYRFGFDIMPVKSSRRDSVNSMRLGQETGSASAAIWCPHHQVSGAVHDVGEMTEKEGVNALQRFVQTYKQADLTLTGAVRKAAHVQQSIGVSQPLVLGSGRRPSVANGSVVKEGHEAPVDEMEIDHEPPAPSRPIVGDLVERHCIRCSTAYSPRWWSVDRSRRMTLMGSRPPLLNGIGMGAPPPSAISPPYHQGPCPPPPYGLTIERDEPMYECHKCHQKSLTAPTPEPRPSGYTTPTQRPVLPTPRLAEYSHPYATPHTHHPTPLPPTASAPPQIHARTDWYPGYDHGPGYGAPPTAPPASHHLNGYQAPPPPPSSHPPHPPPHVAAGPPPHFANGVPPPPQHYATHQSPYGPVLAPSPRQTHVPVAGPRPYASSASPPEVQATMVRQSPQHSISALNGPPPRMYSTDRVLSAPVPSPSTTQASPAVPRVEDTPVSLPPTSRGRHGSINGTPAPPSGASASPSLKNLLS